MWVLQSVTLHTNLGDIKCEIFCDEVPKAAEVSSPNLHVLPCVLFVSLEFSQNLLFGQGSANNEETQKQMKRLLFSFIRLEIK